MFANLNGIFLSLLLKLFCCIKPHRLNRNLPFFIIKVVKYFLNYCLLFNFFFLDPEVTSNLVFLKQPSSLVRVIGQSAVLPCVASGLPTPTIRWMKNEEALDTER